MTTPREDTNQARRPAWAGVLAVVRAIGQGDGGGNVRSEGTWTELEADGGTMAATYNVGNADGTATVWDIEVKLVARESHQDEHWGPGSLVDAIPEAERVIVAGDHYSLGTADDYPRGFGGRLWRIQFSDGRYTETNSLWHQGPIPPKWRERYPDNAVFLTEDEARVRDVKDDPGLYAGEVKNVEQRRDGKEA